MSGPKKIKLEEAFAYILKIMESAPNARMEYRGLQGKSFYDGSLDGFQLAEIYTLASIYAHRPER